LRTVERPPSAPTRYGGDGLAAVRRIEGDFDAVVGLRDGLDAGGKAHLRVRQRAQALDRHLGELVLLALDDEGIRRVVRQHRVVEFGDHAAAGTIPELEGARDEAALHHLVQQTELRQHLQRRRVRRRRPRGFIDAFRCFEDANADALLREGERGDDPDGAATGDNDGGFGFHRYASPVPTALPRHRPPSARSPRSPCLP
jgi:hypothetical protein